MSVFLGISAQENTPTFRFGYLSYETALKSMPEYALVQQKMKTLQEQFQAETLRVEDEFNRKYEDFLDGQRDFPRTILQKRQSELQELMEKNIQFKEQGRGAGRRRTSGHGPPAHPSHRDAQYDRP